MEEAYDYCRDYPDAVEILSDTEAHNAYEVAAVVLSRDRILSGSARGRKSYKDETGFGAEEQKKMFGMFASREKGGRTIEELAEDEFKATCEEFGVRYDNQEARVALIEVLSGARTRGDILNYIRRNRIAEARALVDHHIREEEAYTELLAREDFIDEMHITPEEYESYMEVAQAEAEKALENFDEIEYNSYLADELATRQMTLIEEISKMTPQEKAQRMARSVAWCLKKGFIAKHEPEKAKRTPDGLKKLGIRCVTMESMWRQKYPDREE